MGGILNQLQHLYIQPNKLQPHAFGDRNLLHPQPHNAQHLHPPHQLQQHLHRHIHPHQLRRIKKAPRTQGDSSSATRNGNLGDEDKKQKQHGEGGRGGGANKHISNLI